MHLKCVNVCAVFPGVFIAFDERFMKKLLTRLVWMSAQNLVRLSKICVSNIYTSIIPNNLNTVVFFMILQTITALYPAG